MNRTTLRQQRTERLESLILEGMNSPMSPFEPDWAEKAKARLRERVAAIHAPGKYAGIKKGLSFSVRESRKAGI